MNSSRKISKVPEKYALMIAFIIYKSNAYFRGDFLPYKKSEVDILEEFELASKNYIIRTKYVKEELKKYFSSSFLYENEGNFLFCVINKKEFIRYKKIIIKINNFFNSNIDLEKYKLFRRKNYREIYRLFRKSTYIHRKDIVNSMIEGDIYADKSFEEMLQAAEKVIGKRK